MALPGKAKWRLRTNMKGFWKDILDSKYGG